MFGIDHKILLTSRFLKYDKKNAEKDSTKDTRRCDEKN